MPIRLAIAAVHTRDGRLDQTGVPAITVGHPHEPGMARVAHGVPEKNKGLWR